MKTVVVTIISDIRRLDPSAPAVGERVEMNASAANGLIAGGYAEKLPVVADPSKPKRRTRRHG